MGNLSKIVDTVPLSYISDSVAAQEKQEDLRQRDKDGRSPLWCPKGRLPPFIHAENLSFHPKLSAYLG